MKEKTTTKATQKQLPKAIMNKPIVSETEKMIASQKKFLDSKAKVIRKEMSNIEKAFIRIGYELHEISCVYNANAFKGIGYKDIYDYAHKEFNIARGTCSDFINIIEQFGKRDENGKLLPELDDKYKEFSSSKLSVMISMGDEVEQVKPDMTVKAIKALKKSAKSEKTTSEESEEVTDDVIEDEDFEISNVVISFRTIEEYNANIDKLDELILRCLKAGHVVKVSETVPKVRTSEQ